MSADDITAGMAKVAIAEQERFYDTNTGEMNEDEDQGLSTLLKCFMSFVLILSLHFVLENKPKINQV